MISILIKASLIIVVVLAFYKLFLEKESFFAVNRMYLMFGLILAFVLPFVALPELVKNQGIVSSWLPETPEVTTVNPSEEISADYKEFENSPVEVAKIESTRQKPNMQTRSITFWVSLFYFFGVLVLSINFIAQLVKLAFNISNGKNRIIDGQFTIINAEGDSGPCSFFNYIFIDPSKYDLETYEQILEHEKIHVQKKHSVDFLIAELGIIVLWFNPFVWKFRQEVEKNCEYQTDATLLDTHAVEPQNYQMSLLEIATERKSLTLVSNYNQSLIKKRIIMMNKQKSNKYGYFKYAFIAPVLFVTLLLLNQPFALNAQENDISDFQEEGGVNEYENEYDDDLDPLLRAVRSGNHTAVVKMLQNGADVNLVQRGEGTPLTIAITNEKFEIARFLLEKGAKPNLGTKSDGYPLWMAARKGDIELVRLLIRKGADVNAKFRGDGSALIQAVKTGYLEMIKALVELKADVNMGVRGDGNPLIMAAKGGHLEIVSYLVKQGADVNIEVPGDETPLISASEQGHLSTVKFLVEQGADVNKICKEKMQDGSIRIRTALKMAKKKGNDEVIKYLMSRGAAE